MRTRSTSFSDSPRTSSVHSSATRAQDRGSLVRATPPPSARALLPPRTSVDSTAQLPPPGRCRGLHSLSKTENTHTTFRIKDRPQHQHLHPRPQRATHASARALKGAGQGGREARRHPPSIPREGVERVSREVRESRESGISTSSTGTMCSRERIRMRYPLSRSSAPYGSSASSPSGSANGFDSDHQHAGTPQSCQHLTTARTALARPRRAHKGCSRVTSSWCRWRRRGRAVERGVQQDLTCAVDDQTRIHKGELIRVIYTRRDSGKVNVSAAVRADTATESCGGSSREACIAGCDVLG